MSGEYVIGIDSGGTKVAYGLFDGAGNIIDKMKHETDAEANGPAFADTLIENVRVFTEKNGLSFDSLAGIGICMPSFILYDEGRVLMTSSMTGIKDFPMLDYMSKRLPVRIELDNDGNAAALAEYRRGAGRGSKHMVYIAAGTGLGGGIIIDGKLFRGTYGWAGECGHMLATPDEGIMCGCENRGCFMSYASGRFIPAHVKRKLEGGADSVLTPETANGHTLEDAYNAGDTAAIEIMEQMARYIAICVFNIYQLLNINTFVFGGGLVNFGEPFMGRIRGEFDKYNHIPLPVHFKVAELKSDFGIIGAAEFVRGI